MVEMVRVKMVSVAMAKISPVAGMQVAVAAEEAKGSAVEGKAVRLDRGERRSSDYFSQPLSNSASQCHLLVIFARSEATESGEGGCWWRS